MPYNPNFNETDEPFIADGSGSQPYRDHDSILDKTETPTGTALGTLK